MDKLRLPQFKIQNSLTTPTSPTRPKSPKSPKSLTRPTRPTNSKFKIQNSKFKILLSEGLAKDERRISEGLAKDKSLPARKTQFIIHNSKLFHIFAEFNH